VGHQSVERIRMWDGHRDLGVATITWSGDEILEIRPEPDATEADAGLSLIPGLVDTHVHLDGHAGDEPPGWHSNWSLVTPPEELVFHIAANAQRAMRAGVTTLRELGGDERALAVSRVFDQGIQVGPRLVVHCQVGMTAGHGDLFIPPQYPHRRPVADSPDECRKLVRTWARKGAHGIKIHVSGGVLSQGDKVGWRNQTVDEIRTTIDEAHALGMPVAAHSHSQPTAKLALDEGVDSIEHGTGLDAELWPLAVERGITVAPTLLINDRLADGTIPVGAEAQEKAAAVVEERDRNFGGAAAAGVRFVLGTDANGVMVRFGEQHEEVHRMREIFDWTPERTLVAATSDAAAAVGLGDRIGTLAPGYGADLVIIRGRPWERIEDLHRDAIVAVVSRGRVVAGALPTA
jgi:imidazolonepropionase-like amidohydrolase